MSLHLHLRSDEEVAAIEDCCVEWHRLLPVLLPTAAPEAMLAPGAFFREQPRALDLPGTLALSGGGGVDGGGGGFSGCRVGGGMALLVQPPQGEAGTAAAAWAAAPAAAVLLSYLTYRYFGSAELALVIHSTACLAAAAAAVTPLLPFAALLPSASDGGPPPAVRPQGGAGSTGGAAGAAARGLHPAVRRVLAGALSPAAAVSTPGLFAAAGDVLVQAVRHHPSLLDSLLFPCGLEQSAKGKVCQVL